MILQGARHGRGGPFAVWPALLLCACSTSSAPAGHFSQDGAVAMNDSSSSSGGGNDSGSGTSASCAGAAIVWDDDGVQRCASSGEAILTTNTSANPGDGGEVLFSTLEVVTVQYSDIAAIFTFSVTASPSIGGSYTCAPTPTSNVELSYGEAGAFGTTVASCDFAVTLAASGDGPDGGLVASGTFSAVLTLTDGGTKMLTNGAFHFPVTSE